MWRKLLYVEEIQSTFWRRVMVVLWIPVLVGLSVTLGVVEGLRDRDWGMLRDLWRSDFDWRDDLYTRIQQ